jgi:prepilin-type N-terminal cleavage/methylation domain-containing protein
MSLNNISTNLQDKRGFTIVELLIVIVVIGILAAISLVAYNGITARADTAASETAAGNFAKKAEVYKADGGNNRYPVTAAELTEADATTTYALPGGEITYGTTELTSGSDNNEVRVLKCGSGSPADQAAIDEDNIVGLQVFSFNYAAATPAEAPAINIGTTTGTGIACPTS